ncbi:hypothetical protein Bbelb_307610 [Branchiostoma belcheri]|nr:hypothetical protein Bbelb_307610 [Branchiostoma belcheri]
MAQLSRLAQLYLKISDNLTEEDVRNLRSLLSVDEILGKGKTEKATPLEIFTMLVDNDTIGKGNLGLLVQVLRCLRKGKLANEAERLEQEHRMEERNIHETTTMTPESNTSEHSEPENTDVKEIISAPHPPGPSAEPDYQQTTGDTGAQLASLHIRELVRLADEPMKALGPNEPDSTDVQDAKSRLEILLAELDTPAVMADQEQQCVLYCQIGDLYRAKLYDLQSALQYYQSMLECSNSLSEKIKQAKAHNRLGLTYDMLGKHEEATSSHEGVLEICRDVNADDVDICVACKNLATSFTLSGKVSDAKTNYKTALCLARNTQNKSEEMDIYCKLGDLHREQLKQPQVSHKHYTKMLTLAIELGSKYWEMLAYNRLGLACEGIQDNELALEWSQKCLSMIQELESADKRDQTMAHVIVGVLSGKVNQTVSQLDTALQMAQEKGEEYGQMTVYMHMGDMQREKFNSPRTAVQYYEQYLELARQLGDKREEGVAYNRLGDAHVDIRKYEAALEWYQKHLKISQEIGDKKEEVTILADVGNAYRLLGNTEQATSHFDTALQLAQQTENLHGQMDVYCKMGDLQRKQLHSPRTAIQYYEQCLALARQLGDRREEGWAYNRFGDAYVDIKEYEKALDWYQKHLRVSQEIEDKKGEVTVHVDVGNAYRLLGNTEQATSHFDTALQMAQQTENLHGQMDVYCKMGDLQRKQLHSPRTAMQYYEQSLALARQLGDRRWEGVAYNRLGHAHDDMREYEAALEWYQKALKISQEMEDKEDEVSVQTDVGNAYRLLGNTEQATPHFDTALHLAQQTENLHGQMDVYCKMGDLQREQLHSPRTAIQYYKQYLALARQLGDRREEGWAYNRFGDAYVDMKEYEKALDWYQKHLRVSQEIEDKKGEVTVHVDVGNAYRLLENTEQATSHFDTALQMAQQTENLHGQMDVYCKMGDLQREQLHSPRTAIQYYEQYLALARQLGDRREEGWAYNRFGDAYVDMKEYEKALDWYQKHLRVSQEIEDKKGEVTVHEDVGNAYRLLGNTEQATSHFDTALQMAQQTENLHGQMDVYCKMGDLQREQLHSPRTAIQYYEQYLALARQLGDRREEGWANSRMGHAHYDMREYEAALEWYQKHLKISQEMEDKKDEVTVHTDVGNAYRFLGKTEQATSHFDTALQLAQQTENRHGQMDVYCKMGDMQRVQLHSPRTAIQYYEQHLALARRLGDRRHEGWAYNRLGWAHFDMREYEPALEWHQKALKMSQEIEDKKDEVTAHTAVGDAHRLLGKIEQATSHFDTALQMAQQTENLVGQMGVYCKMGDLQREQLHSPRKAIQYYEQYLALARQLGGRHEEGWAYSRLGNVHVDMKEYETALIWHQKRLNLSQERGDKKEQIRGYRNVGDAYKLLGKLDQATSHFDTALHLAQQTGDLHEEMQVYVCMGDLQREQLNSPRTAIQYYKQALAIARQLKDVYNQGVAYSTLGQAYYDMGEHQVALEWFQKCLEMLEECGDKTEQIAAHQCIAASYKVLGKLDQARSNYETALAIAMETENKQKQVDIYLGLGDLHREQLHEPQESYKYYTEMLALAKDLERKDMERQAYNRLGVACHDMQDNETALEWHQKHLEIGQEDENKTEQTTAHKNMAGSYKALGKLDQSRSHYQSALAIAMETGNKQAQMDIYRDLGDFHREQLHEPQESHKYYTEMLVLAGETEKREMKRQAYARLGRAHHAMGEYEASTGWDKLELEMSQENGDKTNQLITHKNLSESYKALGKPDQARSHYQLALTLAEETENKTQQVDINWKLGDLHMFKLHEPRASHKYYTEMLELAQELGDKEKEKLAYHRLGRACWDMQDNDEALAWSHKFLAMSKEDEDKAVQIIAYRSIACYYQALGKLDQARSHYQLALDIAMETGSQHEQEDIIEALGKLDQASSYSQSAMTIGMKTGSKQEQEAITMAVGKPDQARSHFESTIPIAMKTENNREQEDITEALGKLDQTGSNSQSAMAVETGKTGTKQEQR